MKTSLAHCAEKKINAIPITMVTAYDACMARIADSAGIDALLVGDSVGTTMLGYGSEREVTMADMIHHTAAVARATCRALILADLPFGAADSAIEAETNARRLLACGAECVKIEGWEEKAGIIEHLAQKNIAVCAHIGYNPQLHGPKPRVFGKTAAEARSLLRSGKTLQDAGAHMLVAETIAAEVAATLSERLTIPVIGIGSGPGCDGQVLVMNDLLGYSEREFRHVRRFAESYRIALDALSRYARAVEQRQFPGPEHTLSMVPGELRLFRSQGAAE